MAVMLIMEMTHAERDGDWKEMTKKIRVEIVSEIGESTIGISLFMFQWKIFFLPPYASCKLVTNIKCSHICHYQSTYFQDAKSLSFATAEPDHFMNSVLPSLQPWLVWINIMKYWYFTDFLPALFIPLILHSIFRDTFHLWIYTFLYLPSSTARNRVDKNSYAVTLFLN